MTKIHLHIELGAGDVALNLFHDCNRRLGGRGSRKPHHADNHDNRSLHPKTSFQVAKPGSTVN